MAEDGGKKRPGLFGHLVLLALWVAVSIAFGLAIGVGHGVMAGLVMGGILLSGVFFIDPQRLTRKR